MFIKSNTVTYRFLKNSIAYQTVLLRLLGVTQYTKSMQDQQSLLTPDLFFNNGILDEHSNVKLLSDYGKQIIGGLTPMTVPLPTPDIPTPIDSSVQTTMLPESAVEIPIEVPSSVKVLTENVVATIVYGQKFELDYISSCLNNTVYTPNKFSAVIKHFKYPKATVLVFASGKAVITGATSSKTSRLAATLFTRLLKQLGYDKIDDKLESFSIQNVVGRCDLGFSVALDRLQTAYYKCCYYDAESFPGLIFRLDHPKDVVVLVFATGRIVLTGVNNIETVELALKVIYPVLYAFRPTGCSTDPLPPTNVKKSSDTPNTVIQVTPI